MDDEETDDPKEENEDEKAGHGDVNEKIEKICIEHLDFSPQQIDNLSDLVGKGNKMIQFFLERTFGIQEEKTTLVTLLIKTERALVKLDECYLLSDSLVMEAKKIAFFDKKPGFDKKKAERVKQRMREVEQTVQEVLDGLNVYLDRVSKSTGY